VSIGAKGGSAVGASANREESPDCPTAEAGVAVGAVGLGPWMLLILPPTSPKSSTALSR
jgi:hypothetical protein